MKPLACLLGFHRYGPWVWDDQPRIGLTGPDDAIPFYVQRRCCQDCLKEQGPLVSSEERRYYESWRDRTPAVQRVADQ